jgi:trans-aconitate methyltransferase
MNGSDSPPSIEAAGSRQRWDPTSYARNARFVSDLGAPVLALLDPRPGERVLDLGCGDGALTEKLVAAGCAVVAVDASPEQVEGARRRGLDARVVRAEALPFAAEFDAVFSNAVLHWVKDQRAVLAGVSRALVPGGRFVAEFGGARCVAAIRGALHAALEKRGVDPWLHDPWFFPTPAEYGALLADAGFEVDSIELFDRPTPLPGDVSGWLETFAQPFLNALPRADWRPCVAEVRERLRPVLWDDARGWVADYTRLRLQARRPGDPGASSPPRPRL